MRFLARAMSFLVLAPLLLAMPMAAFASGGGAGASGARITSIQAGYGFAGGGNYRSSGPSLLQPADVWVPVHVGLQNTGGSDISARLVLSISGPQNGNGPSYQTDYTLAVPLAAGARKAVTMYARASDVGSSLTVRLMSGNNALDLATVSPSSQRIGELSVGILSDDTVARALFRGFTFGYPTSGVSPGDTNLSVAQFGDATPLDAVPQALENFDLIVLTNFASDGLRPDQMAALGSWVQNGGTLLVAGGADAQKTLGHMPSGLLAATLRSPLPATAPDLPELARLSGASGARGIPAGSAEYSVATPRPGAVVLAAHGSVPLVVELPLGRGHLVYSAVEPTLAPFDAWSMNAQGAFWSNVMASALRGPLDSLVQNSTQSTNSSFPGAPADSVSGDLGTLPSRSLPTIQNYGLLIVLYILVLGPVNYAVLRWRRRLEWSWVTVPVAAVLFGLGSFGLAYTRNGGDVLTNIDSVLYLDSGAPTKSLTSYIGLFAPLQGDYTLSTPGPALAWGLGNDSGAQSVIPGQTATGLRIDQGPQFSAQIFNLQMWSMRTIGVEQQINVSGAVSAHLTLHGSLVSGTITNSTGLTLRDCAIVGLSGTSAVIPLLAPGETLHVAPFSLGGAGPVSGGNVQPISLYSGLTSANTLASPGRYSTMLGAIFPSGTPASAAVPLALVGWTAAPLGQFQVDGSPPRRTDLDLVVVPFQLSAAGRVTLSPGDLPVGVLATTATPSSIGIGSSLTLNPTDRIDVELTLPRPSSPNRHLRLDSLTLQVNPGSGSSLSANGAQLWNWYARRWVTVDASTGALTVRHAAPYVSADGRVVVRLQPSSSGSLTFNNISQNVEIGASGVVQ